MDAGEEEGWTVKGRVGFTGGAPMPALLAALILALLPGTARAWGLAAHAIITRQAIEQTPEPLRAFLREHRETLVQRSLEPDTRLRRRDGEAERVRHYLNLETLARPPYTDIPADRRAARARYGAERLRRAGDLPWAAADAYDRLVEAFREGGLRETLQQAGHLAHYVSDATTPLHATVNFDGQLTGNNGIHSLYERALIARRAKFFRDPGAYKTVAEKKIQNVSARMLAVLRESRAAVPALLQADREARRAGAPGTGAYLDALFRKVGESARARMRAGARETAALWTSAWIEAGRPALGAKESRGAGCGVFSTRLP
jgi:hypothetical protein